MSQHVKELHVLIQNMCYTRLQQGFSRILEKIELFLRDGVGSEWGDNVREYCTEIWFDKFYQYTT